MSDDTRLDAWMIQRINEHIPNSGNWVPHDIAQRLISELSASEPDRLSQWMELNAVRLLRDTINRRHRSERTRLLRNSSKAVFAGDLERFDEGDEKALDPYLIPYKVDETAGLTAHLGDMTGIDCGRAAEPFERRVAENEMQAVFLRALEKQCGRKKVKNVYTREQLGGMFSSLGLEMAS